MSSVLKKNPPQGTPTPASPVHRHSWISHWELYLIVLAAAFLRFYHIDMTEFNADQADIFRMAHDAVSHAHLVATSNIASIGIFNPPGIIYFLMIAAAFSANPLSGALLTALLSLLSVVLTYAVTCRYYGRLAGAIAAALYAGAAASVFYSRFMWNQNLLLFFVPLFISVLLLGVIERRKGWLAPAIVLVGLLAQLHGSGFLLAAPLVVACLLAPGTIRIRDIIVGALAFVFLYSTYWLWLVHSHYRDVPIFLTSIRRPSVIDNQALLFFQQFLSPYGFDPNDVPLTNVHSLLYRLSPFLLVLTVLMVAGVAYCAIAALVVALRDDRVKTGDGKRETGISSILRSVAGWWSGLRASPYRCALLVLLSWQLVPLVYLLRHSIKLHSHYFIMLMPGPFLLLAIFIARAIDWTTLRATLRAAQRCIIRYSLYGFALFLVAGQLLGGLALVRDMERGNFNVDYNRFNDLRSLQHALTEADQLAQSHHLRRVYISTDDIRRTAFYYLSEQMQTATTVFDDSCAVLPNPTAGAAVLLVGPRSDLSTSIAAHFAKMTLVDQPPRLGDLPFRLYIVETTPQLPAVNTLLAPGLQFLGTKNAITLTSSQGSHLVARWELLQSRSPASGTTYTYNFTGDQNVQPQSTRCVLTSVQAGDQLLVPFQRPVSQGGSMNVQVNSYMTRPDTLSLHLGNAFTLNFDTYNRVDSAQTILHTPDGKETISLKAH